MFCAIVFSAAAMMFSTDSANAANTQNLPATPIKIASSVQTDHTDAAQGAANSVANRTSRQRVGLGFNGIPFDGSHREATRMRRAQRSNH